MRVRRIPLSAAVVLLLLSCAGPPALIPPPLTPPARDTAARDTAIPPPEQTPQEPPAASPPGDSAGPLGPDPAAEAAALRLPGFPAPGGTLAFAVPRPRLWWSGRLDSGARIQLASRKDFAEGSILFDRESPEGSLVLEAGLEEKSIRYLRYRSAPPDGRGGNWSDPVAVTFRPLELPMKTVLAPGKTASFSMGNRNGPDRERPEHPVTLTGPYEMGVGPLTNSQLAEIMNRMLDCGLAVFSRDRTLVGPGVVSDSPGVVSDSSGGAAYLGLKTLNYGFQFGLEERNGRLHPRKGRENHPAVGISRPGAEAVLNALSLFFGRRPVYPDPSSAAPPDREADGFHSPPKRSGSMPPGAPVPASFPGGGLPWTRAGRTFSEAQTPSRRRSRTPPPGEGRLPRWASTTGRKREPSAPCPAPPLRDSWICWAMSGNGARIISTPVITPPPRTETLPAPGRGIPAASAAGPGTLPGLRFLPRPGAGTSPRVSATASVCALPGASPAEAVQARKEAVLF